jgi:UDP-glucose 4-epimerase
VTGLLVTGATGLIGRHLLARLSARSETARGVHAVTRRPLAATDPAIRWIEADLSLHSFADKLPPAGAVESVIHLAQSERFREFPDGAADTFAVNVDSTLRLLDWARRSGVRRFVLASSGGIYGHGEDAFTEDHPVGATGPLGFYLASKHCAELLAESFVGQFVVVVLRFFFVYGPGQRRSMLVPRLVSSVAEGQPIVLQGADGIRINPVHARDAARAIEAALALEQSHKINVGGPEVLTLRQIVDAIGDEVGRAPALRREAQAEARHLVADIGKMTRLLVAPEVPFAAGVAEVVSDLGLLASTYSGRIA